MPHRWCQTNTLLGPKSQHKYARRYICGKNQSGKKERGEGGRGRGRKQNRQLPGHSGLLSCVPIAPVALTGTPRACPGAKGMTRRSNERVPSESTQHTLHSSYLSLSSQLYSVLWVTAGAGRQPWVPSICGPAPVPNMKMQPPSSNVSEYLEAVPASPLQ